MWARMAKLTAAAVLAASLGASAGQAPEPVKVCPPGHMMAAGVCMPR